MATVAEVHAALQRLVDDGNGDLNLVATVDESGVVQNIIDVEVMDDPPYLVLSKES